MKTSFTRLFVIISLLTISFAASAQVYIGGSISGAYAGSPNTSSNAWAVSVNPEVGYAFNENWAVGGRVSYGKSVSQIDSPYLNEYNLKVDKFTVNVYGACSFVKFKGFSVWAEAGIKAATGLFTAYITPVLTYDLSRRIVLKTELNFATLAVGAADGGFVFAGSVGGDDAISSDDLSIGFVFRF